MGFRLYRKSRRRLVEMTAYCAVKILFGNYLTSSFRLQQTNRSDVCGMEKFHGYLKNAHRPIPGEKCFATTDISILAVQETQGIASLHLLLT
jgi:hypothetical protein